MIATTEGKKIVEKDTHDAHNERGRISSVGRPVKRGMFQMKECKVSKNCFKKKEGWAANSVLGAIYCAPRWWWRCDGVVG